ncbi:MAG: glycoside hydrolase family 9 protein [Bacteroidales bacterium]|jgi:hypothetical protein|nr:glycoside hydrolase family 9 protein [Bacteroidales bacterium]
MKHFLNYVGLFCVLLLACTLAAHAQIVSQFILTDQFGYRTQAVKTAVIKNPQEGFDSGSSFAPGAVYQVVNATTAQSVFESAPVQFKSGAKDAASGDQIWWFDFSVVSAPGEYYILDVQNNVKSYSFRIADNVYNEVLKTAVRTFFYQRAGYEKAAQFAGADWADAASHVGNLQDKNCRLFSRKTDASTEKDLHGGWYDAGDLNKYTTWTCSYIESMMLAYLENPAVWTDDYNLPESGNGVPDLLDEAQWGIDWVLRMQNADGSVLCVQGLDGASPPSAAKGQSLYGPATAAASWATAKALALAYKVYSQIGQSDYAEKLRTAALAAWTWAEANPNVKFDNNSSANGSAGLAAGNQEINDDLSRLTLRLNAAVYLYEMTGDEVYHTLFKNNYRSLPLFAWGNIMQQWQVDGQMMFLYYITLPGADATVKNGIITALKTAFNKAADYAGKLGADGYRSYINDYNWGSNKYKTDYGLHFYLFVKNGVEPAKADLYNAAAEDYTHYIHGVNPFAMVYLSNMNQRGASKSVTSFYHTWFADGSAKWDYVSASTPGPAPGFLTGGPNKYYTWDGCCPGGCGSSVNNALCTSQTIPVGEPDAKMYKDFNTSWPLNSWAITENSNGYQLSYIRLLSKFAAEGDGQTALREVPEQQAIAIFPNPTKGEIRIESGALNVEKVEVLSMAGLLLKSEMHTNTISIAELPAGVYMLRISTNKGRYVKRVVKE